MKLKFQHKKTKANLTLAFYLRWGRNSNLYFSALFNLTIFRWNI